MNPPSTHSTAVGALITRLLREAKITQREASAATGIRLTTLKRRLAGKTAFNVNELALLADLLETPISALVDTERAA